MPLPSIPFLSGASSYVRLPLSHAESCAVEQAQAVCTHPSTRELGLHAYLDNILKAQGFEPGRNSLCNPVTIHQCLAAGQMIANPRIGKELGACLSNDVARNKNCLVAHDEMMQAMAVPQMHFRQGIVAVLKKGDPMASIQEADIRQLPHAEAIRCDFSDRDEVAEAGLRVNAHVDKATDGFIRECPGAGQWEPGTRFAVIAAAHLIADWEQPFDPRQTNPENFHLHGGQCKQADMMSLCDARGDLNEKWGKGYRLLFARRFVSAEGQPLTMLYALPDSDIDPLAHARARAHLLACMADGGIASLKLRPKTVDEFKVPKFDLCRTEPVRLPGMAAFVDDPGGLADIRQTVRLQHGEEGVRASASSGFAVAELALGEPLRVVLNRPFDAFVVAPDGSMLFALHVADPTLDG